MLPDAPRLCSSWRRAASSTLPRGRARQRPGSNGRRSVEGDLASGTAQTATKAMAARLALRERRAPVGAPLDPPVWFTFVRLFAFSSTGTANPVLSDSSARSATRNPESGENVNRPGLHFPAVYMRLRVQRRGAYFPRPRLLSREPECTAVRAAKAGPKHVTGPWGRRRVIVCSRNERVIAPSGNEERAPRLGARCAARIARRPSQ